MAETVIHNQRRWFVVVAYAFAVVMLSTTLPTPLYPLYRSQFGFSELMVTVIFAIYAIGVIVALLLLGRISDQIGRRRTLIPGLIFATLSAITFLLANSIEFLMLGRVLSGFSAGIFTGTATATLLDLSPPNSQDRASLFATLVNIGGLGLGPLLAGLLAEFAAMPLQLPFLVDLVLIIPALIFVWIMPEPLSKLKPSRIRLQRLHVPNAMRAVFIPAALVASAGFAVLGLFTAVAPGFLGQILNVYNPAIIGLIVSIVFVSSAVSQTVLAKMFSARSSMVAGSVGLIVGMALLAIGLVLPSLAFIVAGAIVSGLGQGMSFRTGLASINAAAPLENRGEVASSFFVACYFAISVPVVGVGAIAVLIGLQAASLIFVGIVAVLAGIVISLLMRSPPNLQANKA